MTIPDSPFDDERENEGDPLLPDSNSLPTKWQSPWRFRRSTSTRVIIALIYSMVFILTLGGFLTIVPSLRLYEDIICRHYYNDLKGEGHIGLEEEIDEGMCKDDNIQNELNTLVAVAGFLSAVVGLLMTVPYGLLADKIGRRFVLVLSISGTVLSALWNLTVVYFWTVLPLRLIWLCSAFMLVGGGGTVFGMMSYAIGCDITTEHNRANIFLLGSCAAMVGELIAPSVASALMLRSPWIPMITGVGLMALGLVPIVFIPETLHLRASGTVDLTPDSSSERSPSPSRKGSLLSTVTTKVLGSLKRLHSSSSVLHSLPIILLLLTFIVDAFEGHAVGLLIRYTSKRFSWELSKAGLLLSIRAFFNIVLVLCIIPASSYYLTSYLHFTPKAKDLLLAQISAACIVIGAIVMALSPAAWLIIAGLGIFSLGVGLSSLNRSLITSLVDKQHIARLYAAIAIVQTTSGVVSGPIVAGLYAIGLKLKGPWLGLPFFGVAIICFVGSLGVWSFTCLTKREGRNGPYNDEERDTFVGNTVDLEESDIIESGVVHL